MSNAEISFGRVKMQLKIGAIMMLATVLLFLVGCDFQDESARMKETYNFPNCIYSQQDLHFILKS